MAKPIVFVGATLVAGALGAMVAVLAASWQEPEPAPAPAPERVSVRNRPVVQRRQRRRRIDRNVASARVFTTDTAELTLPAGASLSELISSPDESVRLRTAQTILRQGSAALPQVRALHPRTPEGEELTRKLALALQKMQMNERHVDWGRREPTTRMKVRLAAFRMVLPEEMLAVERQEFWVAEVETIRRRVEAGRAQDGELALAELELARVRRQRGDLDLVSYSELVDARLAAAQEWVATLRKQGRVPPAHIARYEEQLAKARD